MRVLFLILLVFNVAFALWHVALGGSGEGGDRPAAPAFINAPLLRLVADVAGGSGAADVGSIPERSPSFEAGDRCWTFGPFDAREDAENMQTRLSARAVAMVVQERSTSVAPDFWVHVPPRVNRQAAMLLLRQLQGRGVDSSIIAEGELANGISLGFFSSEKSARQLLERHQDQVYPVDLRIVPREISEFWGLIALDEYSKLGEEGWRRFLSQSDGVIMEQNVCDAVATTDNFE